jgi:NAD(P)-dependent dehydrogenase (short-subunit alcohol dehydrogenase family)
MPATEASDGRLAGKVAIVTGAGQTAGEEVGNGRATAIVFAREGAKVILADRDRDSAESTRDAIVEHGGEAFVVEGDVSVEEDCNAFVSTAVERFGRVDIVHNNVGIATGDGWAEWIEIEAWERIMRVNAGSVVLMAKAVLPVMKEQASGAITNVSSIASVVAGAETMRNAPVGYKMSKAAMNAITQALAGAYAPHGIRVNAILPGLINTPMGVDAVARQFGVDRDEYIALRNETVPLKGGMGSAWDIANAALFLASEEARFITGVLLAVDGGQSARVG